MLFIITYVILEYDLVNMQIEYDFYIPIIGYKFEWWMALLQIDWYIKAFGSSLISIFPIMFITMTQSYLNDYVKELA